MSELTINFLDLGQGEGIYILFPNYKTMLVDFGSNKNKDLTSDDALAFFKKNTDFNKPNKDLHYLVLTHGDGDHYNLVEKFRDTLKPTIKNVLHSGRSGDYKRLISKLSRSQREEDKADFKVLRPSGTYPFTLESSDYFGGVTVEVLAMNVPGTTKKTPAWRKNTGSIVLRLEYAGVGVLLTGDATWDTEEYILKTFTESDTLAELKSAVLKLGHHGSARTSISEKWIKAIKPEFVFISSDRKGALSDRTKTGYRLPQQLTIDIIEKNTKLHTDFRKHSYVSAYDPDDYVNYKDRHTGAAFVNPHPLETPAPDWADKRCWLQTSTDQCIYTTLVEMDKKFKDGTEADQGTQYMVQINDEAEIDVYSVY